MRLIAARRSRLPTTGLSSLAEPAPGSLLAIMPHPARASRGVDHVPGVGQHGGMPVEPPPSRWVLPDPADPGIDAVADDLVATGADLEPGTLLAAYRCGL